MKRGVRSREPEWIDLEPVEGPELRRMLSELSLVNRFLGGTSGSLDVIKKEVAGEFTLLDAACGGGDLIAALATAKPIASRTVGCDLSHAACAAARARVSEKTGGKKPVDFVAGDAFHLPFADRSFDVVHSALFLHHVPDRRIPELLRELLRVARRGVLINDLRRDGLAEVLIRILTALFSRSRFIRHDAPLSVQRGLKKEELAAFSAAVAGASVRAHWAFRLLLWIPAEEGGGFADV